MIRFYWGLVWCLLFVSLVATVDAQEGQKGRRGGRGGLGFGGGNSVVTLAANEAVQKELGVDQKAAAKLESIADECRTAIGEEIRIAGGGGFQNLSDDERQKLFAKTREVAAKVTEKFEPRVKESLTADQFKRLQEITIQAAGPDALSDPRVAKELSLSDEQTKKIGEIRGDYRQKARALFDDGAGQDARAKMRELREEEGKKVTEVLTAEQQEKFTALKGKSFDLSQIRGGFGGAGGGRPGAKGKNRPKTE